MGFIQKVVYGIEDHPNIVLGFILAIGAVVLFGALQ